MEDYFNNFKSLMIDVINDKVKEEVDKIESQRKEISLVLTKERKESYDEIFQLKKKMGSLKGQNTKLKNRVDKLLEYQSSGVLVDQNAMQRTIDASVNDSSACIFNAFAEGMEDCKVGNGTRTRIKLAMEKAIMKFDYPEYEIVNGQPIKRTRQNESTYNRN